MGVVPMPQCSGSEKVISALHLPRNCLQLRALLQLLRSPTPASDEAPVPAWETMAFRCHERE